MSRWFVSVPVWGERYVGVFCATALPAMARAIEVLRAAGQEDVILVVHTDQIDRVQSVANQTRIEHRPIPAGLRDFDCMSQAHREVLRMAARGDVVVPLTADDMLSEETLAYCADVLANPQKLLVACAVPRATEGGKMPEPLTGPALMEWAWANRHPITSDMLWPDGRASDLSRTYYAAEGSVATRVALPHPLAIRIDGRPLSFTPTVDVNLVNHFDPTEIHVVPDCRRLAVVELSPLDKGHETHPRTMRERLESGEWRYPAGHQQFFVGHQIMLVGDRRDCGDIAAVAKILRK